ncbi:MAG: tyrosine-protein phosphatase [bacterium]|nr:tyrosine-protein phosphatase [bacterium]
MGSCPCCEQGKCHTSVSGTASEQRIARQARDDIEISQQKAVAAERTPKRSPKQRKIKFQSTRNARDLGGLPTRNGYIKDAMIYRSGAFCYATAEDVAKLGSLGLNTIIDLRTKREIEKKEGPDRLPSGSEIVTLHLPMAFKGDTKIGRYYSYALDNDESVGGFFHALANPKSYPLLYHCSAGKDRTGVLTALLLELLGTPRPIIMEDYLQSQRNSKKLEVNREWLREVFRLIDKAGGVNVFLVQQGANSADLKAIPAILEQK